MEASEKTLINGDQAMDKKQEKRPWWKVLLWGILGFLIMELIKLRIGR
jgi:hypothetical protein